MLALIRPYAPRMVGILFMAALASHFIGVLALALALMGIVSFSVGLRWGAVIGVVTAGILVALAGVYSWIHYLG